MPLAISLSPHLDWRTPHAPFHPSELTAQLIVPRPPPVLWLPYRGLRTPDSRRVPRAPLGLSTPDSGRPTPDAFHAPRLGFRRRTPDARLETRSLLEVVDLGDLVVALRVVWRRAWGGVFRRRSKHGHDVVDGDHEQEIVGFEVDRDGILGMKQDFVVLADGKILVARDLALTSTTRPVMVGISAASGNTIPPRVFCRLSSFRTSTRFPTGSTNSLTNSPLSFLCPLPYSLFPSADYRRTEQPAARFQDDATRPERHEEVGRRTTRIGPTPVRRAGDLRDTHAGALCVVARRVSFVVDEGETRVWSLASGVRVRRQGPCGVPGCLSRVVCGRRGRDTRLEFGVRSPASTNATVRSAAAALPAGCRLC